jgi:hypothetical protein
MQERCSHILTGGRHHKTGCSCRNCKYRGEQCALRASHKSFHKSEMTVAFTNAWNKRNHARVRASQVKHRIAHPNSDREYKLKNRFGISISEYDAILEKQGGRCMFAELGHCGGRGRLQVEHNHDTGEIRGISCFNHNQGLSHFGDNAAGLVSAAAILRCSEREVTKLLARLSP